MNAQQARAAMDQEVIQTDPKLYMVGFWCFVLLPFEDSRNGTVLHYWMSEKEKRSTWYVRDSPHRGPLPIEVTDRVAACGITNKNRWTPTTDYYTLKKLPKCKKCLRALRKIVEGEEHGNG